MTAITSCDPSGGLLSKAWSRVTQLRCPGATGGSDDSSDQRRRASRPDAVIRTPLPSGATGADALTQVWAMLLQVYPDIHLRVQDLIAHDDKVGRTTVTATHQGEFMGVAATGKP